MFRVLHDIMFLNGLIVTGNSRNTQAERKST